MENSNQVNKIPKVEKEKIILPSSFVIKLQGEFGSSGADRNYNAKLVFQDGKLVEGEATLHVGPCTGEDYAYIAHLKDGKWIDQNTNDICEIDFNNYNPITKEGLEDDINSNTIKLGIGNEGHDGVSYELIK